MHWFAPELEPKLVTVLREGLSRQQLMRDALAGIVVGIVAFPLAIAFGIASGVRPEQGLFTAVVAGFVISLLSGSRVQIGGPTGAFVVLVADIVARHGYEGLVLATMMAGILLIAMGLARLGQVIRFIPYPVTVGFTSGIAVIIAVSQVRDALGLELASVPAEFGAKLAAIAGALDTTSLPAVSLCVATILVVRLWPGAKTKVPGALIALVLTTLAADLFGLPVDTIESRFGSVPAGLPAPHLPAIEWQTLRELSSPAIAIALLAGIESLLSALVADGMTGRRHRANAELIAQGVANLASPLFGGIPATGAIARTATNVKNGGTTPFAGIFHALTLLVMLLAAGPLAARIPLATLAGVLFGVAYNMSEWRVFARILRGPRSDVLVLLTTFGLTVAIDLTVAIQAGVVLAALLLMRRMAEVTQVRAITDVLRYGEADEALPAEPDLPAGIEVFEINGSFCFGAAQKFGEVVAQTQRTPQVVILRMRHVLAIDATGMQALDEVAERFRRQHVPLLLSGLRAQPREALERTGLLARIGAGNAFETFREAVEAAKARVAPAGG